VTTERASGSPEGEAQAAQARKRPRGNLIALALAQVLVTGSGLLVQVLLARYLGTRIFGTYASILGVVGVVAFLADFNLSVLLARQVARAPEDAPDRLAAGLAAVGLLAWLPLVLTVSWMAITDGRPEVVLASAAAGVASGTLAVRTVTESVLQGLRRMQPFVAAQLVGRGLYVAGTAAALMGGLGLVGVFGAQALGPLAAAGVLLGWFLHRVGGLRWPGLGAVRRLVTDAVPFAANRAFGAIYIVSDLLVVSAFWPDEEVGLYRVASILILQLPLLASILNRGLYPRMSRQAGDPEGAGEVMGFALRILLVTSLPLAVGGMLVAGPLLDLLVGPDYAAAAPLLMVMLPILPLRFVNNMLGNGLSALDRQNDRTRGTFLVAVFNVATNLALVPFLGALGAAVTTVASEVLLLAWQVVRIRPVVGRVALAGPLLRILPGLVAMAAVVVVTAEAPVLARIGLGALGFALVGWVTRAWTLADVKGLLRV
jgi:O-antigen/teichoic acid export membrane protein